LNWHGVGAWVGVRLMKLLGGSLRWELKDEAGYLTRPVGDPVLVAAWHNRIFALPLCYQWLCKARRPLTVLTSASRDGGFLSALVARFGIGSVRGSSSRRGSAAVRELAGELKRGADVIITPDGPRGPRYALNPGLMFLARQMGIPIMPVRVEYDDFWELKSWDRFRIPKPFSKVRVHFLPLQPIGKESDASELQQEGVRLQGLLGGD
jgi:lysophospholipid acyltransferase (LPLAT)-like uncharacterized protein